MNLCDQFPCQPPTSQPLSNGHQWASAFSSKKLSHTNAPTAHMFDIHSALHHRCANIDAYIDRASPQKTGESIFQHTSFKHNYFKAFVGLCVRHLCNVNPHSTPTPFGRCKVLNSGFGNCQFHPQPRCR